MFESVNRHTDPRTDAGSTGIHAVGRNKLLFGRFFFKV